MAVEAVAAEVDTPAHQSFLHEDCRSFHNHESPGKGLSHFIPVRISPGDELPRHTSDHFLLDQSVLNTPELEFYIPHYKNLCMNFLE